ncbi:MAG: DNA-processing protein DprA [Pseudomonadota bacterium]
MASDLLSTPPPLAPPKTWDATVIWLRLIRSHRVGPQTFFRLLGEHGSAEAALEALPQVASKAGVAKYAPFSTKAAQEELQKGKRLGAKLLCFGTVGYPKQLADLPDPPPVLWALGDISLTERPNVALVGARNASSLGTRMAGQLAKTLGEAGFVITSGLARGVDAAAHLASLESGTIAVQAGGVDEIYPCENAKLHDDIAKQGLRLSEQPLGLTPMARHFPRRNRIISGLARAVVVVEAAAKSGSLITAREALDQGREVLAVPGHPFDARAAGCNMLIRDGATLVRGAKDVIDALEQPRPRPVSRKAPKADQPHGAGPAHAQILGLLGPTPVAEDQLIRDLKVDPKLVAPQLLDLEMQGKITRSPGGLLALA